LERGNDRKIDGRRVVVDYERGRTKQEWVPRKLGGGKGDKRRDRETERVIRELKKNEPLLINRSRSRSNEKVTNELINVKSENLALIGSFNKEEVKT
jgi:U1 small nuclear ribonucleoprotein